MDERNWGVGAHNVGSDPMTTEVRGEGTGSAVAQTEDTGMTTITGWTGPVVTRLGTDRDGTKTTTTNSDASCRGGNEPAVDDKPTTNAEGVARVGGAREGRTQRCWAQIRWPPGQPQPTARRRPTNTTAATAKGDPMTSRGRRDGTSTASPGSSDDDQQGGEERGRRWLGRRSTSDRGDLTGTTTLRGGTMSRGWSDGSSTAGPRFNDEDRREREERCLR
jgi:hypothetical protein